MSIFHQGALAGVSRVAAQEATEAREQETSAQTGEPAADFSEAVVHEMEALAKKSGRMQREMGVVRSVAKELYDTQNGLADAHGKKLGANALSLLGASKDR